MIGQVFTRLKVLSEGERTSNGERQWVCQCTCGERKVARGSALRGGYIKSCGCLQRESRAVARKTHGLSGTAEYRIWSTMLDRCRNPNAVGFENYGGRGIRVCVRWRRFEHFLEDMGPRPPGFSLERINNRKGYSPSNCRWASRTEQNWNKRNSRLLTADGETLPLAEWARRAGIAHSTLRERLIRGWPVRVACTTPAHCAPWGRTIHMTV